MGGDDVDTDDWGLGWALLGRRERESLVLGCCICIVMMIPLMRGVDRVGVPILLTSYSS